MSLDSQAAGSPAIASLLDPVVAANTAAATTTVWQSVAGMVGYIVVEQQVGVLVGTSLTGQVQQATSSGGAGAANVPNAAFAPVTASSNAQKLVIPVASITGGYIGYQGTLVGTSAAVSASFMGSQQNH